MEVSLWSETPDVWVWDNHSLKFGENHLEPSNNKICRLRMFAREACAEKNAFEQARLSVFRSEQSNFMWEVALPIYLLRVSGRDDHKGSMCGWRAMWKTLNHKLACCSTQRLNCRGQFRTNHGPSVVRFGSHLGLSVLGHCDRKTLRPMNNDTPSVHFTCCQAAGRPKCCTQKVCSTNFSLLSKFSNLCIHE